MELAPPPAMPASENPLKDGFPADVHVFRVPGLRPRCGRMRPGAPWAARARTGGGELAFAPVALGMKAPSASAGTKTPTVLKIADLT